MAMVAAPPKSVTAPPPATAKPVPAPPAPKSVASLIQQSNIAPPPAKPAPAPKTATPPPAMKQALVPPPGPATGAPRQLGLATAPTPAAKPIAAVPTPGPASPAAAGGYVLQIGAYKSQADAEAAWKVYKARHAALLTGYSENVQQVDLGEKGTWYRLRVGGLGDREVALALCDRLKADGGACILSH
jgi:cell division septation protein DedD